MKKLLITLGVPIGVVGIIMLLVVPCRRSCSTC